MAESQLHSLINHRVIAANRLVLGTSLVGVLALLLTLLTLPGLDLALLISLYAAAIATPLLAGSFIYTVEQGLMQYERPSMVLSVLSGAVMLAVATAYAGAFFHFGQDIGSTFLVVSLGMHLILRKRLQRLDSANQGHLPTA